MLPDLSRHVDMVALSSLGWATPISLRKAAAILRLDPSTLREQIDRGMLKAEKVGRCWRVKPSAVMEYAERHLKRSKLRRWSAAEVAELRLTGDCPGRSPMACKLKRMRIKRCSR